MANEIQATYDSGDTLYVLIFNDAGQVWDSVGSNWENYDSAQQGNYDIARSETATNTASEIIASLLIFFGHPGLRPITSSGVQWKGQ